jgi:hypothetical protein
MTRRMSRSKRKAAFLNVASEMYDELEAWYDKHPDATYGEINGRDSGYQVEGVHCSKCGAEMEFKGYPSWKISGLEGETKLERAYYVCPKCEGETIFPPGSETSIEGGSLE